MEEKNPMIFKCGAVEVQFTEAAGCLPAHVILTERDGKKVELLNEGQRLEAEFEDGTVIHPVFPEDENCFACFVRDGVQHVEFTRIPWADQSGNPVPDFYLSIRHEFMPDGTAFTTASFYAEQFHPRSIRRFELIIPLHLENWQEVFWGISYRPEADDGPLIQSVFPERFLKRGENRSLKKGIFPTAGFCARSEKRPAFYGEFFVEGDNTVSGRKGENDSSVVWEDGSPVLHWNFQNCATGDRIMPLQWRNRWGWILTPPPAVRHLPPMRMYHFFDLQKHYPDQEQMAAMADAGCDVLVFHENWRLDVQNDGMPYDISRFRELVRQAHEHGIRVAVYIRGNELSVCEDSCSWFSRWLQKDFDGLYMDYGSPFGATAPADEMFQNGRILFREHYMRMSRLRQTVGRDGVFYSHTGPLFSAVGMNFMDGYVSGEGEQGILVKGRPEHEYFSMAYVNHGTMWTAAFPEYSSERMVPFLAAAGQYPHNPVGVQMPTSSLAHPPEPGINDLVFRPLWKLWSCFRNEKDMAVFNDYNCRDVFQTDATDAGFYLMVSADGARGLLVVTNFSRQEQTVNFRCNWRRAGLKARQQKMLLFDADQNPLAEPCSESEDLQIRISPNGVAGILMTSTAGEEEDMLREFLRPYHRIGAPGKAWLAEVEEQRFLRNHPPEHPECWLRLHLPYNVALPYEDSLIIDLYAEKIQLGEFDDEGGFQPVGWIGAKGLTAEETADDEMLLLGEVSPALPLHRIFGPGRHRVGICSYHLGMPFYSFVEAWLSDRPEGKADYRIVFRNELEENRAFLRWTIAVS